MLNWYALSNLTTKKGAPTQTVEQTAHWRSSVTEAH